MNKKELANHTEKYPTESRDDEISHRGGWGAPVQAGKKHGVDGGGFDGGCGVCEETSGASASGRCPSEEGSAAE